MCWVCFWAKQKPAPANATVAHRLSSQDLPVLSALLAKPVELFVFSKQAVKYTLLYFLFHKKTRAEETCVNKPGGAPLAVGSQ